MADNYDLENSSVASVEVVREKRYCCDKLTKKQLIVLLVLLLILGTVLGAVVTYFIANAIIKNSKVQPTAITMNVDGYNGGNGRKLQNVNGEFIRMALNAAVTNGAMLGGVMRSTEMEVYAMVEGEEKLVVSMKIPDTEVGASVSEKDVAICSEKTANDEVCILKELKDDQLKLLHQLVSQVLTDEFIQMRMYAPNGVQLKAMGIPLPFSFGFDKTFKAAAMNGAMDKVKITGFDLTTSTKTEMKFVAKSEVTNPSIFGFTLLPSKMAIYALRNDSIAKQLEHCEPEIFMGIAVTEGPVLLAANATVQLTMAGVMDESVKPECVENFVNRYFTGKGNKVIAKVIPEATESQYLNTMLRDTVMHAEMTHGYDGDLFSNTVMNQMTFRTTGVDTVFGVSTDLNCEINSPVGESKMKTLRLNKMDVTMKYNGASLGQLLGAGELVGESENDLHIRMQAEGQLTVDESDENQVNGFKTFVKALMTSDEDLEVVLDGAVGAAVETALGVFELDDLRLNSKIKMKGMGGLAKNRIAKFDLERSTSKSINMDVDFDAFNPTPNQIESGPLRFDVQYDGTTIGYLQGTENTVLKQGWNTLSMVGQMLPNGIKTQQDKDNLGFVLSNYLKHENTTIIAAAAEKTTDNWLLNAGMQGIELTSVMEPLTETLIKGFEFESLGMMNPLEESIDLEATATIDTFKCLGSNGVYRVESIDMDTQMKSDEGKVLGALKVVGVKPTQPMSPRLGVPINGVVQFADHGAAMGKWMEKFIASPTMGLNIEGTTDVYAFLPGFPFSIPMRGIPVQNKVTLDGMNKAGGIFPVDVIDFDLPSNSENGINIDINAKFSNPSMAEISAGTLYGVMNYKNVPIGTIVVPDFKILSGDNKMHATGEVVSSSDASFEALQDFFNAYLAHESSECTISAFVKTSTWFSNVLQNTAMVSVIDGMDNSLQAIQSIAFNKEKDMDVYMLREGSRFSGQLVTEMKIPFDFPVTMKAFFGTVALSAPGIEHIGDLTMERKECIGDCRTTETLYLDMEASLNSTKSPEGFQAFVVRTVAGSEDVAMIVKGDLTCSISTNLNYNGRMLHVTAPMDTSRLSSGLLMPAFNNMGPIKINGLTVSDGESDKLPMETTSQMCNPTSFVNMYTSPLELGVYFKDRQVARLSTGEKIVLKKNSCTDMSLTGFIDHSLPNLDRNVANDLFENYINNRDTEVVVRGEPSDYLLQNAMSTMSLVTTLPALQCVPDQPNAGCPVVRRVDMKNLKFNNLKDFWRKMIHGESFNLLKETPVDMYVYNPFKGTSLRPFEYNINIAYNGKSVGYIDQGPQDVVIEGETVEPLRLTVKGLNGPDNKLSDQIKMSCDLLKDELYVDAGAGTALGASIGKFNIRVGYVQNKVKISCNLDHVLQKMCDTVMSDSGLMNAIVRKGLCRVPKAHRERYLTDMHRRRRLQYTL